MIEASSLIRMLAGRVRLQDLCESTDLDPAQLNNPCARIGLKRVVQLYELLAQLAKDSFLGLHAGAQADPRIFGLYHYVVKNSPTLGEALRRAARYLPLWNSGIALHLEIEKYGACIVQEYRDPSVEENRQYAEMVSTMCLRFSSLMAGNGLRVREAHFQHDMPRDISEHRRMFKAPVYFQMSISELIFNKAALAYPLK